MKETKTANVPQRQNKDRYTEEHKPKTVEQIEERIARLKSEIAAAEKDKEDKDILELVIQCGQEIVFLERLLIYVKQRQKAQPGEVLFPTSEKGLSFLYNELKSVLVEFRDDQEFAEVIPDLERNVSFLRDILKMNAKKRERSGAIYDKRKKRNKKKSGSNATSGRIISGSGKNQTFVDWFVYGGLKLVKPNELAILSEELNVIADGSLSVANGNDEMIYQNAEAGDYTIILKMLNRQKVSKPEGGFGWAKQANITIKVSDIIKAREQRFNVALGVGGQKTAASLIVRGLGKNQIDGRLKKPETIIERYKEQFLSEFSLDMVLRDIKRIIELQS